MFLVYHKVHYPRYNLRHTPRTKSNFLFYKKRVVHIVCG